MRRATHQPPSSFAPSLGLSPTTASLLWNGLASSTQDRTGSSITAFYTFCALRFGPNAPCLPASSLQLLEWLGSMSTGHQSYHSAKHDLGHLCSYHIDLGGFGCGCLERALQGYKHLLSTRCVGAKLPITLPLLQCIVLAIHIFGDMSRYDRQVYQAAFTLAFACFLRSGEVVWECSSDPAVILRVASVALADDHAIITLPASKTDPFRLGVKVVAPLMGGPKCPISHLRPLLSRPASSPLFGLGPSGTAPLSRSAFVSMLQWAITACGLSPSAYAGHSFCRGAATWAASLGADAATIQCLGQWNSDCFWHYIDRSATHCQDLSITALYHLRDGPLIPPTTSWRDMGSS
ncbi:hypothetical protein NDA18_000748 [Ustilago nuda]|nr:hypothetical protein NDA18_000748 [Ustilago nuda]